MPDPTADSESFERSQAPSPEVTPADASHPVDEVAAPLPQEPTAGAELAAEPETPPGDPVMGKDTGNNLVDQAELDALAAAVPGLVAEKSRRPSPRAAEPAPAATSSATELVDQAMAEAFAAAQPAAGSGVPDESDFSQPAIIGTPPVVGGVEASVPFTEPELEPQPAQALANIDLLDDVELDVKIELGRTNMYIEDVLRLGPGSVIELDKLAGDPVDIYVNERLVARGEVLVLNDNFCVRINDIHSSAPEAKTG